MKTRFDLEEDITALYSSAADLYTVADRMYDSDMIYNSDRVHTVLTGLAEIIEAKVNKLEDTFCQVHELNQYAPDEAKERREAIFNKAIREAELTGGLL